MNAQERLTHRLVLLAAEGRRPRCGDYGAAELFTSEDHRLRAIAARWCAGCPAFTECDEAATENHETFGIWAGRDRKKERNLTMRSNQRKDQR